MCICSVLVIGIDCRGSLVARRSLIVVIQLYRVISTISAPFGLPLSYSSSQYVQGGPEFNGTVRSGILAGEAERMADAVLVSW
jgi:hypothetical protein